MPLPPPERPPCCPGSRPLAFKYHISSLPRPTDPSYLYKAEVRDVIDADT